MSNYAADNPDYTPVSYLKFSLDKELYAIPLLSVKEVIALPETTPIPNTPKYFLGIMNLRGKILSLIDLRTKLNIRNHIGSETTVIICEMGPYSMGIVVDTVLSVMSLLKSEIKDKPEIKSQGSTDYITGIVNRDSELVLLIDILKALDMSDREMISKSEKAAG